MLTRRYPFSWDAEQKLTRHKVPTGEASIAELVDPLVAAGLDPATITAVDHDQAVAALRAHAAAWSAADAASAWVAGLWSAPSAWRSALTGRAVGQAMPRHAVVAYGGGGGKTCRVCGHGDSASTIERDQLVDRWAMLLTSGAPIDGDVANHMQAFDWFGEVKVEPTDHDRWALQAVLTVLRGLPPKQRYSKARDALHAAKILPTRAAAQEVLEELALVGVLADPEHPGMLTEFTRYDVRDARPDVRVEVQAPLAWWSSEVGVNEDVLSEAFPGFEVASVDLDAPRPAPQPAKNKTLTGALVTRVRALTPKAAPAAKSVGSGPPAAGDVWTMRLRPDVWAMLYLHEIDDSRARPYARVEFLAGLSGEQPTEVPEPLRTQPRYDGRWHKMAHSLDKTPWTRRIATGVPAPITDQAWPDRCGWGAAKDLKHLAESCFKELA